LADVYDALTTKRIYKDAYSHEVARSMILDGSGRHFDPQIVEAFVEAEEQFLAIRQQCADEQPVLLTAACADMQREAQAILY
jgi:putative two-component system response regulator